MDTQRKLIVGYDLCEDFSQISCYSYKTFEPIPICISQEDESCQIPTVLCLKQETKLWVYGEEAVKCASNGEGILIDQLLRKVRNDEKLEVYGQMYSGLDLLEKFIRKSLTLIKNHFPTELITKIVITIRDMEPILTEKIYKALSLLGIDKDRAVVISHASAYLYYALNQDKSLWMNDVGMFDFNELGLSFYRIAINRRAQPMIALLNRKDYSDTFPYDLVTHKNSKLGYAFENIANAALYKQIISTLYFTGKGFEGDWAEDAIKSLCKGRRVFYGQNIYTNGACYAAKELSGDQKLEDYILLNDEMIVDSIWVRTYSDAKTKEVMLTKAAIPWYEVKGSIEVIPDDEMVIEIIRKNIMTRDMIRERFTLEQLPNRPNCMTRLKINLIYMNKSQAKIIVRDLGFGDVYPQTSWVNEFAMEIE